MRLRYTRQAIADLSAIADYIRLGNSSAAVDVETATRSTIDLLADFPKLGRNRAELGARALGVRHYPFTTYYRIEDDEVWIVHIRDDRQKPPARSDF